jgi:ribosomal protein L11 methyltransferase
MLSEVNASVGNFDELMSDGQSDARQALHVVLSLDANQVELGVDFLMQFGARAVEERAVDGAVELWSVIGDAAASTACISECAERWAGRLEWVDTTPSEAWKSFAEPVVINDELVIIPSWQDTTQFHEYDKRVVIDPEESFGLGDHPTTRIVADALTRQHLQGLSILDMGSGSGVLSIVAALYGAERVLGVDRALGAAAIAERNGVSDTTEFRSGSQVPSEEQFGLIAANILAPVLLDLAESLVNASVKDGVIILSGLHVDRSAAVVDRYKSLGCAVIEEIVLDGWFGVVMKRMK